MRTLALCLVLIGACLAQELGDYHTSNLQFTSDVYKEFTKKNDGNFLICPISAQTILSLVTIGAKDETADQLTKALRMPSDASKIERMFQQVSPYTDVNKDYQLTSANKIYASKAINLKNSFKSVAENTFKVHVENINFSNAENAANEINQWVENKTNKKIKDVLAADSIRPDTLIILVNTVFFKGDWVKTFGRAFPARFYATKSEVVDVDMMTQRDYFNYYFDKKLNVEFLELPLRGNDIVMTIVLPKEKDGLSSLEKSISDVLARQPYEKLDAIVSIPKFTTETEVDFKSILQSLGATLPFSNSANFNGIGDIPLKIDDVVQKTFIEVTEVGVTAAAATEISLIPESMPRVTFTADHPFIYYLRHEVTGVLFVGRFTKP